MSLNPALVTPPHLYKHTYCLWGGRAPGLSSEEWKGF